MEKRRFVGGLNVISGVAIGVFLIFLFVATPALSAPVATLEVAATSPHIADNTDYSIVLITAKDSLGQPVIGANVIVIKMLGKDSKDQFSTINNGDGTYTVQVPSDEAGTATLRAVDVDTEVTGEDIVEYIPDTLSSISISADKPRDYVPKNETTIKVIANDAYGNQIFFPQTDITITSDLGSMSATIYDSNNGSFSATLTYDELGTVNVTATDNNTGGYSTTQMVFPALYVGSPAKGVYLDEVFTVPLNIFVPFTNRALGYYDLKIMFNGLLIQYISVSDGDPTDEFDTPNVELIDSSSIRLYQINNNPGSGTPYGSIDVANITFKAVRVGDAPITIELWNGSSSSLVDTQGVPLPSIPNPGEDPKVKKRKAVCLKIHVVDGSGVTSAEVKADVDKAYDIYNAAKPKCCAIKIFWDEEIDTISQDTWNNTIDIDNPDGKLEDFTIVGTLTKEEKALMSINRDNACVNVYYVKELKNSAGSTIAPAVSDDSGFWGIVLPDTTTNAGDPESKTNDATNDDLAHEIAHILMNDGTHPGPAGNLMDSLTLDGSDLTVDQCTKIMGSDNKFIAYFLEEVTDNTKSEIELVVTKDPPAGTDGEYNYRWRYKIEKKDTTKIKDFCIDDVPDDPTDTGDWGNWTAPAGWTKTITENPSTGKWKICWETTTPVDSATVGFDEDHGLGPAKKGKFEVSFESGPIETGDITVPADIYTDIKANGSDGPVNIPVGTPLIVTVALDAGLSAGIPADWYVCATSPFGPYYYTYPSGNWVPGACSPAVSNYPLFDLPTYPVLNMTLPAGAYTFCFTVDTGTVYSDCVDVNIGAVE